MTNSEVGIANNSSAAIPNTTWAIFSNPYHRYTTYPHQDRTRNLCHGHNFHEWIHISHSHL